MTNDEDTGYGRPPVHSRWKKGQSGNPAGRPKSRSEIIADAAAILAEPVSAKTPDGRRARLDAMEAGYLALCKKGLKGHKPSLLEAIRIMLEVDVAQEVEREIEREQQELIEEHRAKMRRLQNADVDDDT